MFRSDVFRHARARKMSGKPSPVHIYDIVNSVVAQHLSDQPLFIPDFGYVLKSFPGDSRPATKKRKAEGGPESRPKKGGA